MSKYENLTSDELISELEDRDETIDELTEERDEAVQERDDLSGELSSMEIQLTETEDKESLIERAFNSGFEASENGDQQMRSWLNYKIGERL